MDSKGAAPTQVYEDFVPTTELVQEQDCDTLLLDLTGFKKEQVRVQLTRTGILKISGQRLADGQNKWLRFQKDFPVSENCDKTKISAKFENGILYVKQPKLITSSEKKDQELPTPNAQQPKKPAEESQPQKKDEEQTKGEKTPTPTQELPKKQANADKLEKVEPNAKEAKDLAEKPPVEGTGASSTVDESKLENDANIGTAAVLAEKLKMPRKMMNMTLIIALLVLGIGLYISNIMKNNNYKAEE
ncbi:hypothetical protein HAX54_039801 [Datura stramonium]|uniref:SHSP domain-containing protein n=1 Tax=Datura stramonium TaxID=4076 RepID=A0ABS8SJC2_DATST|nr:hypothetical protein [Datura stramonium]